MRKLIELYHECHKRALNLIIVGIKEENDEEKLEIGKEKL